LASAPIRSGGYRKHAARFSAYARNAENGVAFTAMGRSVIGICAGFGVFIGGFIPELWGASTFSLASFLFSVVGGAAGIWLGVRLSEY
jgi:predicted PurR-regulated permease PerM